MSDPTVTVVRLRTDDDSGLTATANATPRLSWSLAADRSGVLQRGYEVQVAPDPGFADPVSSGEVDSDVVVDHDWPAAPLTSRQVAYWRVRVRTDQGWTAWGEPACVEAALLEDADWTARPVFLAGDRGRDGVGPAPLLRREFELPAEPVSARLYLTALGVHRTTLNGRPVGDELLEPGWTSYRDRLLYATHDVTALLRAGRNVLAGSVGDGWFRGNLGWDRLRDFYGDASALLAQLEVRCADGSTVTVSTDEHWRGGYGAVRAADLYDGCDIDLREEPVGWAEAGFDDAGWEPVGTLPLPAGLSQRALPPVRVLQEIEPQVSELSDGTLAVDAGQNVTGWLRLRVTGPSGARVTVRHAEVLDEKGRLVTTLLRSARATDTVVLAGGTADLEPEFTFHGFRYAEVEVPPGVTVDAVRVAVVASDLRRTGQFSCSNPRVDQLFSNVIWSQRDNFLSIPTDCPQRDERLGWTGDIMAFAPTAAANFDSRAFLDSWLTDVGIEQLPSGGVPMVVPNCLTGEFPSPLPQADGAAGWADAVTVVPAALFRAHGSRDLLRRHVGSMQRWVDYVAGLLAEDGTWSGYLQLGDWLDPNAPPERPFEAVTDRDYVATVFVAHSARLLAATCRELGRGPDADRYAALGDRVAQAAWAKWADLAPTTQTGCALAIVFGSAPDAELPALGDALAGLVRASGGRIGTGFLGTPFVLPALTATGHLAEAYQLLLNEECPGWLYQIRHGATTMWERWDGILADGSVHPGQMADGSTMSSFNHYAYGAVASWLYESVAGLSPAAPGYREVLVAPQPGGGLTRAAASIETEYGPASVGWSTDGATLTVDVTLPPGTTGRFAVPAGWSPQQPVALLGSGQHTLLLTGAGA
ncbi:Alpha-L-rhamnosidase [Modestobacter italicus]|uniref:alpha-L-rhamnosidase n=1 Tax=Modestobacter italicus (strain DSM 44449 / CECT 9708 / BC 501) TaxID=2732864 RepID=I4EYD9_MODI5|nr:alpha-L-rhamnosidase [Modestobacter marinus]CCH88402.1 Alpha-L-rhamnosidase [Modestobacter marinus]